MISNQDPQSFDYIIHEANGIVGVKGEVRVPISKEDWERAHPKHADVGCNECTFVADQGTILAFKDSRQLRQTVGYNPIFVGKFTMPGWAGHSGFYLFRCVVCNEVCVDYPHGYHGPYWYLRCSGCRCCLDLNSSKFRAVYEDNGSFVPKFLEEVEGWLKKQLSRLNRSKS